MTTRNITKRPECHTCGRAAPYGDRGRNLRKLIDYFCHLAVAPHAYADIKENDARVRGHRIPARRSPG